MSAARTRPKRSRAGLVLAIALTGLAVWELVEVVAPAGRTTPLRWAFGGGKSIAYRAYPYVNFALAPEYTFDPGPSGLVKTTNAMGFRGPDVAVPKPAGTFRIVCLGGSTTWSDLVHDEETYPAHLQRMLREARPDRAIEVVNAGVPSYTSGESLANLAFRCLELEPDAVIVYHAANDYRPRAYETFEPSYAHYRKPWDGTLDDHVPGSGEFGGINALVQRREGYIEPDQHDARRAAVARSGAGAFRRNLTSLCGVARAHGARPVLVTFAASDDPSLPGADPVLVEAVAEHNRVIRAVAAEQDALLVDLDGALPREGTFGDPVHLTAAGTEAKARIVADGLLGPLL